MSAITKVEFQDPDAPRHTGESLARRRWLAYRRTILTATDVPAILGLDPNKSAWSVWVEKVTGAEPEDPTSNGVERVDQPTEAMTWGNLLEEPVALEVGRRTGRRIVDHGRFSIFTNSDLPVPLGVTLDREIMQPECLGDENPDHRAAKCGDCGWTWDQIGAREGALEIKTVGAFADPAKEWDLGYQFGAVQFSAVADRFSAFPVIAGAPPIGHGGGPVRHVVQLQTQLMVMQWEWGLLAGLNGSPAFNLKIHYHDRDDELISWILTRLERFWSYVVKKEPPPADSSKATADALASYYAKDNGQAVDLPPIASAWAAELSQAKSQAKVAKNRIRAVRNQIQAAMGANTVGVLPDGQGGFKLPRLAPRPSMCGSCGVVVQERAPYRRLTAFGQVAEGPAGSEDDGDEPG